MKTLILMRHAKSAWDDPQQKDIDRPLGARGRKAAPKVGAWLKAERYLPDVVLCSTARRARETLELVRPSLPKDTTVEPVRGLYMAAPREMLTEIGRVPATAGTVMLVGHNPGIGNLAVLLAGDGDETALANLNAKFPTAAVAVLGFDVAQWNALAPGNGKLLAFLRPRDLD